VEFVEGHATIQSGSGQPTAIAQNIPVHTGDTVQTEPDGEVHLKMEDGGYIALRPKTVFRIDSYQAAGELTDSESYSLLRGALRSVTGWIGKLNPNGYQVNTVSASLGIRGTDHEVIIVSPNEMGPGEETGVYDRVNAGTTVMRTSQGTVDIPAGKAGRVPVDQARMPQLLDKVPKFLNRRRTHNESRVSSYSRHIQLHVEEKLQKRGLLKPGEQSHDYFIRKHKEARSNGTHRSMYQRHNNSNSSTHPRRRLRRFEQP
jgi:hypothetical protein